MKRIFVLRHSKAGQTNKKLTDDHERPLTQKGVDLCRVIARNIESFDTKPDYVLSSTAIRTKQTAENITSILDLDIPVEFSSKLYLASADDVYEEIHTLDDSLNNIIILGHNPGLQLFCMHLAGTGDKRMYRELKNHYSPGTFAVFDLDIASWMEVRPKSGKLIGYANPKKEVKA